MRRGNDLASPVDSELRGRPREHCLDGLDPNPERGGDFAVGRAVSDKPQDILLPLSEGALPGWPRWKAPIERGSTAYERPQRGEEISDAAGFQRRPLGTGAAYLLV